MSSATGQKQVDDVVNRLPDAIGTGLTAVVNWIQKYAEVEGTAPDNRRREVFETLRDAGFKTGEYTGKNFVEGNKYITGRYIVGQVMEFLADDRGLPNAAHFFPDQYNEMPGEPVAPAGLPPAIPGPISVMRPLKLKSGH